MRTTVQVILLVIILFLGYAVTQSIMKPIMFNREKDIRYNKTIDKLKDIRTAQLAFKSVKGSFSKSFDSLIQFVKNDSFKVVKQIGSYDDSVAVALGKVYRETISVSVLDSLFKRGYSIDSLKYVPFTDKAEFEMGAGEIKTGSGVKVKVFEVKVSNDVLLHGMNKQLVANINHTKKLQDKYSGLKVGDLTAPTNNSGNWE